MAAGIWNRLHTAWRVACSTWRIFSEIDAEQRAASFAYYALFSLIPLVALFLTLGSLLFDPRQIIQEIARFAPISPSEQQPIWTAVHSMEHLRGGVGVISVLILMWTSHRFFQSLVRAVNRAWHTIELPWWQVPLKNLAMIGVVASGLVLGILIPAILQGVRNAILALDHWIHLHFPAFNIEGVLPAIDLIRYLVGGIILFYAISVLYMLAPRQRVFFRDIWMAAVLVTLCLQTAQIGFVDYLPRLVNYSSVYGAFSGLLFLLFWIYVSGLIIIAGACLCAALKRPDDQAGRPAG
jgi:YihY family inner membrane protein